jgi:hypothetical protein
MSRVTGKGALAATQYGYIPLKSVQKFRKTRNLPLRLVDEFVFSQLILWLFFVITLRFFAFVKNMVYLSKDIKNAGNCYRRFSSTAVLQKSGFSG